MKLSAAINSSKMDGYNSEKLSPTYIGQFKENSDDDETTQIKHYWGAVYSKG